MSTKALEWVDSKQSLIMLMIFQPNELCQIHMIKIFIVLMYNHRILIIQLSVMHLPMRTLAWIWLRNHHISTEWIMTDTHTYMIYSAQSHDINHTLDCNAYKTPTHVYMVQMWLQSLSVISSVNVKPLFCSQNESFL